MRMIHEVWTIWLIGSPYLALYCLVIAFVHMLVCKVSDVCGECGRPLEDKHE